jgi:hypothetical protein
MGCPPVRDIPASGFERLRQIHKERDARESQVGRIELLHGRLEVARNLEFLTSPGRVLKAFVNNYGGVFAEKSSLPRQLYHLDHFIAGLFAQMEPGSVLVTMHPLNLGLPFQDAEKRRKMQGLSTGSPNASFFEFEEIILGQMKDVVSWAKSNTDEIKCYKYTRLPQESTEGSVFKCCNGECRVAGQVKDAVSQCCIDSCHVAAQGKGAVFQCCNKACPRAQAGTPIPATEVVGVKIGRPAKKESRLVVNSTCPECKVSVRRQPERRSGTTDQK